MTKSIDGVSIVIAVYNEEGAITPTIEGARRALEPGPIPFEIIIVDDGSSDSTGELAGRAGAVVCRNPHNVGYGRSLKRGIALAKHDTIVIVDADGTYPLDRIPSMIERYRQGFDMVVGQRSGERLNETVVKGLLRRVLKFIVEYSAGRKVPDVNSGLRVFSRAAVMEHFPHLCDTFSFTTSMTLAYMMNGRFVAYEPIDYHDRIGKTKVRLFREALRTLQFILQATIYYNPLKFFLLISFVCLIIAIITFALAMIFQIASGFLLGVGIILVALLIFAMGLLADLLRQIMAK